ncbi:MAG: class I SAM-dependent methyltransferase, partial [Spirochaetaceae bacterium]
MPVVERQDFGIDPTAVRETDHYQLEYIGGFVDKWDQLISWEDRAKGEGDFFLRVLREHGVERVLDVAAGTGFHSVRLIEE